MTYPLSALPRTTTGLAAIQAPVKERLERVFDELRTVAVSDFDMVEEVNQYLLSVPGKLFRPTLVLLSSDVGGKASDDSVTLGAVVELVHMATLVHDDAVDHSVLRRGMPTVNSLWTHQIAIIMGDYLYSRAVTELARLGDLSGKTVLLRLLDRGHLAQFANVDDRDQNLLMATVIAAVARFGDPDLDMRIAELAREDVSLDVRRIAQQVAK